MGEKPVMNGGESPATTRIRLGFSTCPNDTFIFYALVHGEIPWGDLNFQFHLADVEELNRRAGEGRLEVSKISIHALGHLRDRYGLLRSGGALGWGCGPLVVCGPDTKEEELPRAPIAVPGRWTTAHLLLTLYLGRTPQAVPMPFHRIIPAVAGGEIPFGVLIHEGRLTYPRYGLRMVVDLGAWWEQETGLPVPLGGIAARKDLGPSINARIQEMITQSIAWARKVPERPLPYIRSHAQEMDDSVIGEYLKLYVNELSEEMGEVGMRAVEEVLARAEAIGLIPRGGGSIWAL